ncbi:glycoside hydrolase family 3 C-terminal domain-containing protein [Salipaludibacillus sp. CUR1]|uniref:glycoside hydrolase family 3 N-terminal domain-containing protein n=1 Tax=Salipaludibacillus sp. CUR1 TaxID=2820003 RepID=UPI001E2E0F89|nr:glycoside hydrolase family 3 N-terminal domain-containing protein [Salipaludibacillus sp. CUR1]MCE7791107.1 glycoside hydrolase family 3 C-terminal domain-containing protein [Salipaludibacillus sp. CUR1]
MKSVKKTVVLTMLAVILAVSHLLTGITGNLVQADEGEGVKDLIIFENVPEADAEVSGEQFQLKALNVYGEGHFTLKTEGVTWESSNKNVASVEDDGTVTLSGQPGRTFIKVSDGEHTDRIALHSKVDRSSNDRGKPDTKPSLIKQEGEKYNVISHAINNMTLEEKVGQMLMPDFRNWNGENVTEMLPEIEQLVKDYHLGGVILFRENVVTTEQTAELVAAYQEAAEKFGLLMTIDQEGGIVTRLQSGTDFPGNMALGATRSEGLSYDVGHAIGEELNSLGINMNLAPVLDVNNNPDNPVIGVRSFGEDPDLVGELGVAYTKGLQDTGVAATAKHFPGHGDTDVDSHLGLPEVPHDIDRLFEVELSPFQQAMDADIDAIMTAHVTFPKIDATKVISEKTGQEIALPATLSHTVLTDLMRGEMNYEGVIITDAMNMQAISDHFGPVDAAIRTVKAGSDIVLMPVGLEDVAKGLLDAVEAGEISEERVEASVERILTLKVNRGIIKEESPQPLNDKITNAQAVVGSDDHKMTEREVAEKSVTLVKNDGVLPLEPAEENIVVIGGSYISSLGQAVQTYRPDAEVIRASSSAAITDAQWNQIRQADKVIVGTTTATVGQRAASSAQMAMVRNIADETDAPLIAIGIRNPYDVMAYHNEVDAYVAQYGFREASFAASAATLFGENAPSGQLPVTIPDYDGNVLYEFGHGLSLD